MKMIKTTDSFRSECWSTNEEQSLGDSHLSWCWTNGISFNQGWYWIFSEGAYKLPWSLNWSKID